MDYCTPKLVFKNVLSHFKANENATAVHVWFFKIARPELYGHGENNRVESFLISIYMYINDENENCVKTTAI